MPSCKVVPRAHGTRKFTNDLGESSVFSLPLHYGERAGEGKTSREHRAKIACEKDLVVIRERYRIIY